jgi:hypothetical protein
MSDYCTAKAGSLQACANSGFSSYLTSIFFKINICKKYIYVIFPLPLTHSMLQKCTLISWASLLLLKYFVILGIDGDNTFKNV